MNLQEAIQNCGENWLRPVAYKGQAYTVDGNRLLLVPSPRGGSPYMTNVVKHLIGEWEIVTPDQVFSERD